MQLLVELNIVCTVRPLVILKVKYEVKLPCNYKGLQSWEYVETALLSNPDPNLMTVYVFKFD